MKPKKQKTILHIQQEIEVKTSSFESDTEKICGKLIIDERDEEVIVSATKTRKPKCAKCRNHGVIEPKKNHKGVCGFEDCGCPKCRNIDDRRHVLKHQVRIRRQLEQQDKQIVNQKHIVHECDSSLTPQQLSIEIPKPSVSFIPMYSSAPALNSYPYRYSQLSLISHLSEASNADSLSTSSIPQPAFQETAVDMSYKYSQTDERVSQLSQENAYNNNYYQYQSYNQF